MLEFVAEHGPDEHAYLLTKKKKKKKNSDGEQKERGSNVGKKCFKNMQYLFAAPLPVPLGLVPELCRLLVAVGPEGIIKVINSFFAKHPQYNKLQVGFKIYEIAVQEYRPGDGIGNIIVPSLIVWRIRDEYKKFLEMENFHD